MRRKLLHIVLPALAVVTVLMGSFGGAARADGLAIPGKARINIVDLQTIRLERTIDLKGNGVPVLASHPSAPIVASVIPGGGLTFWNTPSFTQASQISDPLFDDVSALAFSPQGDRLFMLSPSLRAVLAFGLQTSKVESIYPIPGGNAIGLDAKDKGLIVRQQDGLTILEPSTGVLLGQWRLNALVNGAMLSSDRLTLAVSSESGLLCFNPATGARLAGLGGEGGYGTLYAPTPSGFFAFCLTSHTLESWLGSGKIAWTALLAKGDHELFASKDGSWLYALGRESRMLSVFETVGGRKLGVLPLAEVLGPSVRF